jgi:hypothetical protein
LLLLYVKVSNNFNWFFFVEEENQFQLFFFHSSCSSLKELNSHKNVKINFHWFGWFILWWYFNFISNFFVEKLESFNVSFSFVEIKIVVHSFAHSLIHWIHFLLWRKIETKFSDEEIQKTNKFIQTHSFLWFLFSF